MTRTAALRLSILVSMGIVPLACSGSMVSRGDGDGDAGGTGNAGGSGGSAAGKPNKPNQGGSVTTGTGGGSSAGSTGRAGSPNTSGTGGVAGEGPDLHGCSNGKLNPITGLVTCEEGYLARPSAKQCEAPNAGAGGAGGASSEPKPRATGSEPCSDDPSVCDAFELGHCRSDEGFGGASSFCASGCLNDADCGANSVCLCSASSDHGGTCVSADCRTNADCGADFVCASYSQPCGPEGFACTKQQDECPSSACVAGTCSFERSLGYRVCDDSVCGRPFLVEQQTRVAPVVFGAAWSERAAPSVSHLTAAERAQLAAHWTRLGQMEHASIAAFARFQLQLLALGAPPDLVQACNQALVDETAHTRLCFGLASAYAGKSIGPGTLDVAHSLDVSSLADIVELVLLEGCFGETSAALEALEAADAATDPVIRDVYARIAADEQRHAELAFRFVQWALQRDHSAVAERIHAALPHAPAAVRDVAVPCLQALLDTTKLGPRHAHSGRGLGVVAPT